MTYSNVISIPCEKGEANENGNPVNENVPYCEADGSILYLASGSHPDIAYSVSVVSEGLEIPKLSDWNAVKRIFKFLKRTLGYGLFYPSKFEKSLKCLVMLTLLVILELTILEMI